MSIRTLLAVFAVCIPVLLPAQERKFYQLEVKRAVEKDAAGLQQWAKFEPQNCPECKGSGETKCGHCARLDDSSKCMECKGKKRAPCYICAGKGKSVDPLLHVICPGCYGSGCFDCVQCGNDGANKVEGDKKESKCPSCKGVGGFACTVCDGERLVPSPALKPSVGEAEPKDLQKAKQAVDKSLAELGKFKPTVRTNKDVKDYTKALSHGVRVLPPLKKCQAMIDEMMKGLAKGDMWKDNEQRKADAFTQFKAFNERYLQHQRQLLDLCIQRAEANEKVGGK